MGVAVGADSTVGEKVVGLGTTCSSCATGATAIATPNSADHHEMAHIAVTIHLPRSSVRILLLAYPREPDGEEDGDSDPGSGTKNPAMSGQR